LIYKKAEKEKYADNTLSFENNHEIINHKLDEIVNIDSIPIFNYLIMENLTSDEYNNLDKSFKSLLPKDKIIFSNSNIEEIIFKLSNKIPLQNNLPSKENLIGNLFFQYTILQKDLSLSLCSQEQINFINSNISGFANLTIESENNKTDIILLKAIFEKLKHPQMKIIIIEKTVLACDILKQKLLRIIEYYIIDLDLTSIKIVDSIELTHLKKLNFIDLIICDDAYLFDLEFINHIKHIQKKSNLLLVTNEAENKTYSFSKDFKNNKKKINFLETNPYPKAMQIIDKLLINSLAKDILVVSSRVTQKKLNEELKYFIKEKVILLDSSKKLLSQDLDNLLLSTYSNIYGLKSKYLIILDPCFSTINELKYAFNICSDTIYVLYEDNCKNIKELKGD